MPHDTHIFARAPILSGVVLGIVPLPLHVFLPQAQSYQLAAITLVLIAGVYIGYAFMDGRVHNIVIELTTAVVFSAASWLGLNGYPMAIVGALVLHGIWDILHHGLVDTTIPRWYIPFCAVVDWVMAASLIAIWTLLP